MKITNSLAHAFGVVTIELQRMYAYNYGLNVDDVVVITQNKTVHILLKGKPFDKMNVNQIHKVEYKKVKQENKI